MSALATGVVALIIFLAANVILTIPVFATRGRTQMVWFGITSILLLGLAIGLITIVVLVSNETITIG